MKTVSVLEPLGTIAHALAESGAYRLMKPTGGPLRPAPPPRSPDTQLHGTPQRVDNALARPPAMARNWPVPSLVFVPALAVQSCAGPTILE
jgi:hypothetical protein